MKKLRNTIACGVAALALLATGLTSCTGDFDNINTSKDKPTPRRRGPRQRMGGVHPNHAA